MTTHPIANLNGAGPVWKCPEGLQQLIEAGEENLVAEVIEIFKNQTVTRLRLLRNAVEQGRMNEARAQAHTIKGGGRQVGAERLADVCELIEMGAVGEEETAALVSQAEALFQEECRFMVVLQQA